MSTAPLDATCSNCRHSRIAMGVEDDGETEEPVTECWRYPPIVLLLDDGEVVAHYRPTVTESDTCGEHQL